MKPHIIMILLTVYFVPVYAAYVSKAIAPEQKNSPGGMSICIQREVAQCVNRCQNMDATACLEVCEKNAQKICSQNDE